MNGPLMASPPPQIDPDQRGATHYPHSRVDSGTLLQNPVEASEDKPKVARDTKLRTKGKLGLIKKE